MAIKYYLIKEFGKQSVGQAPEAQPYEVTDRVARKRIDDVMRWMPGTPQEVLTFMLSNGAVLYIDSGPSGVTRVHYQLPVS